MDETEIHKHNIFICIMAARRNFYESSRKYFTKEEDELLLRLVGNKKDIDWKELTSHFVNRTTRQLRERWINYLDPNIVKSKEFTEEDDRDLINYVIQFGTKWKIISALMGRTENQLKQRFHRSLAPKIDLYKDCAQRKEIDEPNMKDEDGTYEETSPVQENELKDFDIIANLKKKRKKKIKKQNKINIETEIPDQNIYTDSPVIKHIMPNPEYPLLSPLQDSVENMVFSPNYYDNIYPFNFYENGSDIDITRSPMLSFPTNEDGYEGTYETEYIIE